MQGPPPHEVTRRETYDDHSGDLIGVTEDWPNCRYKAEELPRPHPRRLRTVFYFDHTEKDIPRHRAGKPAAPACSMQLHRASPRGLCSGGDASKRTLRLTELD